MEERGLLETAARLSPPWHVMGGVAEHALLDGRLNRPHCDLDLLVSEQQLGECFACLQALGLVERDAGSVAAGQPRVVGLDHGVPIEIWSCVSTAGGWQLILPTRAAGALVRLALPEDTFEWPQATLSGRAIQTVSPLALYYLRATSAQTRSRGNKLAADVVLQTRLRDRFLGGLAEVQLQLSIIPISIESTQKERINEQSG